MNRKPSWGLIVANCQQEKAIFTCLKLAAEQTHKPQEIIIVDAGSHWKRRYERIVAEIFNEYPSIRWVYLTANGRSPARQRHEAILLATAEVLFLFDEDLLMYPNCAEEIVRVYEADSAAVLSGVQACLINSPPSTVVAEETKETEETESTQVERRQWFSFNAVRNFISQMQSRVKLPRFKWAQPVPHLDLPAAVQQLNIVPINSSQLNSSQRSCMTYRRQAMLDEQFEPMLVQYAMYEDSSVTYLPARHKPAVKALDAKVYRYQSRNRKLTRYQIASLEPLSQPPSAKTLLN